MKIFLNVLFACIVIFLAAALFDAGYYDTMTVFLLFAVGYVVKIVNSSGKK